MSRQLLAISHQQSAVSQRPQADDPDPIRLRGRFLHFVFPLCSLCPLWFKILLIAATTTLLAACVEIEPTDFPAPVLVTLPGASLLPVTLTPTPDLSQPTPTLVPTLPVPTPPAVAPEGIGATARLWEWNEVARPSALAATSSRLAVIIADGRFGWVNAQTGKVDSTAYLWNGLLQGDSWGEVYTDGIIAVAAVREQSVNAKTGLADSRSRLAVYDAQGDEIWSRPELGSQHFYSATLASGPGLVIVGKWPHGFGDNDLAAYELFTGQRLWRATEKDTGWQQLVHDGTRLYALLTDPNGGGVASYDLRTGDELWRWSDPAVRQPEAITLGDDSIYVLSVDHTVALDSLTGQPRWIASLSAAPDAGIAAQLGAVTIAPAPSVQTGFRPGVVGLDAATGNLAWHALGGLLVDPLTADPQALWVIVKDYDSGVVYLSGLEPDTGLERLRIAVGDKAQTLYQLVALDQRVYVLGDILQAFGY